MVKCLRLLFYVAVDEENRQLNGQEADKSRLPTGDLVPEITVQLCNESEVLWSIDLLDVKDDLESQYLAAKASTFPFTLEVRGKGSVEGVLWCVFQSSSFRVDLWL